MIFVESNNIITYVNFPISFKFTCRSRKNIVNSSGRDENVSIIVIGIIKNSLYGGGNINVVDEYAFF